ncbi:hypothetical protein [Nocardia wallacei]|uniref:hypothetical protein n=1 Tax=Nocardia wallacei TaxID=480035 RepID=UPI002456C8D5|nr:hypothetical protein [Nocardia wallacei]
MRTYTEIDGDTATVRAGSAAEHEQLARVLLEAAGPDRKREVRGMSTGGKGFRVPVDIAKTAGLIPEEIAQLSPNAQDFVERVVVVADQPTEEEPAAEPAKEEADTDSEDLEPQKAPARKAPAKKAAPKKAESAADGGDS